MLLAALLAQTPSFAPNPGGLPGASALADLVSGLAYVGLLACGAGIILGAGMWGIGASSNPYQVMNGKRTIILSALGAAIIGMSTFLVRWAFGLGSGVS
ncbi:MAG: DUF6112 family protein [Candidatus Rokuibacteriota bacterium]